LLICSTMKTLLLSLAIFITTASYAQNLSSFNFQNGDLLFQDLDCGDLCDAIEAVTPGLGNKHFSHVGLIYRAADSIYVIEAIGKDVHLTSISTFLQRQTDAGGNPKVVVGRLKPGYQKLIGQALGYAISKRGTPYDDAFLYNNGKYYCSELIYDAYMFANNGRPFFNLYPMTFIDPKTKKTFPAWKKYYKELGIKVPEGKQGCNPGSIAISDAVDIIKEFY